MSFDLAVPDLPFSEHGEIQHRSRTKMSDYEIGILYKCKDDLLRDLDVQYVIRTLYAHGLIQDSLHGELTQAVNADTVHADHNTVTSCEILISHIPFIMHLIGFVEMLNVIGYRDLAAKIHLELLKGRDGGLVHVQKTRSGQRPVVHKFFRGLKRKVHDAQFKNPRLFLRQLANRYADKMFYEDDPIKKQLLADKCIAIIGAEIDAIAITFDSNLCNHDAFDQLKNLVTDSSNSAISDVVYFGRLANANSINGNFNDSEDLLVAARCKAYNTGPCLELVNMLYIEVYVKLWQFEHTPTESIRQSLLMWGRVGLQSLEEEDQDTKTLWRRMFILRMVFCLLGLGNRANVIEHCTVDESCMKEAEELLEDIDRNWYGIEARRKMFYYVAKARLYKLKFQRTNVPQRLSDCIEALRLAKKIAVDGRFEELKFIVKFFEQTVNLMRLLNQRLSSESSCDSLNIGNHVLLKSESVTDTILDARVCGFDESRNYVMLQLESSYSQLVNEEPQNLRLEFCQSNQVPEYQVTGTAYDFVLLKRTELLPSSEMRNPAGLMSSVDQTSEFQSYVLLRSNHDCSLLPLNDQIESSNNIGNGAIGEHFVNIELTEDLTGNDSSIIMRSCRNPFDFYIVSPATFTSPQSETCQSNNFVNLHSGSESISLPCDFNTYSIIDNHGEAQQFIRLVLDSFVEIRGELNTSHVDISNRGTDMLTDNFVRLRVSNSNQPDLSQQISDAHVHGSSELEVIELGHLQTQRKSITEDAMLLKVNEDDSTDVKNMHDETDLKEPNLMNLMKDDVFEVEAAFGDTATGDDNQLPSVRTSNQLSLLDYGEYNLEESNEDQRRNSDGGENVQLHIDVDERNFLSHDRNRSMSTSDYNLLLPAEQLENENDFRGNDSLNS